MSEHAIVRQVLVTIYEGEDGKPGPLSVQYNLKEEQLTIAMLKNAIDAVKNNRKPRSEIIVPAKDVSL